MKCSICSFENRESAKFCGNCGKALRFEIAPKWKWGSMNTSLAVILIYWFISLIAHNMIYDLPILLFFALLLFGLPATIYIMYKERKARMKYGPVWILFFILVFPAIVIDLFASRKISTE